MNKRWTVILLISLLGNLTIGYVAYKALEYRNHINYFLEKYLRLVDEISGREVYAISNDALRADSIVAGRIVFLGTQVTRDWDLARYFGGYEAINRGVDGQWVAGYLLRFRPDVIELLPQAVVIEVSSYNFRPNHSVKEIQDYVASLAELAAAHDITPVLTTVIPPRADYSVFEHEEYAVRDSVALYNRLLTGFAVANEFKYADFCAAVSDEEGALRPELSVSRVDLNDSGYAIISRAVQAVLPQAE